MTDSNVTQFKMEGRPAFPVENTETDNSADPSSVDTKETTTDSTGSPDQDKTQAQDTTNEGDDAGLAGHPRWKEREGDWTKRFNDQETRHATEIQQVREGMQSAIATAVSEALAKAGVSATKSDVKAGEVPSWFGGDEDQWTQFLDWNEKQVVSRAKEMSVKEIESRTTAEQKAIDDATTYFNESVTSIETDKTINPDGLKVDRNKLLKFVLDNDLVDSKGRWNYRAGFQMMRGNAVSAKTDSTKDRKALAAGTTADNRAETKSPAFLTSKDFSNPSNRPW